jgi:DNA replication and repair protein RecF
MWLKSIGVENCRIIQKADLDFSSHVNLIEGDNGSGKTSLLESIYLLSTGRSFRSSKIKDVISHNKEAILVTSCLVDNNDLTQHIGVEKSRAKTRIRINKADAHSQSALSLIFPITLIHPQSDEVITGSPSFRRRFIDWIAFYQFPDFHRIWNKHQRILRQRNACLRDESLFSSLDYWTQELCAVQPKIHEYRNAALSLLNHSIQLLTPELISHQRLELSPDLYLTSGYPQDLDFSTSSPEDFILYHQSRQSYDIKTRRTNDGIHRSDLRISVDGVPISTTASRGQIKIYSILLYLSQSQSLKNDGIILIDDINAELDDRNRDRLIKALLGLNKQLFITSTDTSGFPGLPDSKLFHVKQGVFSY